MPEQAIASRIAGHGPDDRHPGWYNISLEEVTGLPLSGSSLVVTIPQEEALWLARQILERLQGRADP